MDLPLNPHPHSTDPHPHFHLPLTFTFTRRSTNSPKSSHFLVNNFPTSDFRHCFTFPFLLPAGCSARQWHQHAASSLNRSGHHTCQLVRDSARAAIMQLPLPLPAAPSPACRAAVYSES